MSIFDRNKKVSKPLPEALQSKPENPVRYQTVLDYLVNLSEENYTKMVSISKVYRTADAEAATILGVENKPITGLNGHDHNAVETKHTDDEIDLALDDALEADTLDLLPADSEPAVIEPGKEQAPSKETKIAVQD